jgi:transcriptional regulator with XRE-family HTH domain
MAGIIYPNIEKRRDDLGVSKERMREKLGISAQALANKLDGTSEFSAREVRTLSLWWNVSADELLDDAIIIESK